MTDSRSYVARVRADGSLLVLGSYRHRATAEQTAETLRKVGSGEYVVPLACHWVRLRFPADHAVDREPIDGSAPASLRAEHADIACVRARYGNTPTVVELWERDPRGAETLLVRTELLGG